jgi:hypothetical protein
MLRIRPVFILPIFSNGLFGKHRVPYAILEARMPHEKTIGKPVREIRTSGLKGDLRKRSPSATAPEVYQ